MSDTEDLIVGTVVREPSEILTNGVRTALGISGIIATVLGLLILVAPLKTASIITAIIAIYALVSGVIYLGIAIFSKKLGSLKRTGHGVIGAFFIIVGIFAFTDLGNTTTILATFVAILIGIAWITEGVVALTTLSLAANRLWVGVYAGISVVAGVVVLFAPFSFAAVLWVVLGISLIVLGLIQIVRGFAFKGATVVTSI